MNRPSKYDPVRDSREVIEREVRRDFDYRQQQQVIRRLDKIIDLLESLDNLK